MLALIFQEHLIQECMQEVDQVVDSVLLIHLEHQEVVEPVAVVEVTPEELEHVIQVVELVLED
tara:strand:- start:837 stop:1025 length:189 start_codon:yes stop_codon:yes gene_type:complete